METIKSLLDRMRVVAAVVVVMVGLLSLPKVCAAQRITINVHIDGVAGEDGNGNYTHLTSYSVSQPAIPIPIIAGTQPRLNFSIIEGTTSFEIMQAVATHQTAATAELQVVCNAGVSPTVVADYQLSNLHFDSVHDDGLDPTIYPQQPLVGGLPLERVTLDYGKIAFTYQPTLANCQKNGPPDTTFTRTF